MLKEKLVDREIVKINIEHYIHKIESMNKIIIWGASGGGQKVYNFLKEFNLNNKVIGFADNDKNKWGGEFNHLKILSPNEVIQRVINEENLYIILAVWTSEIKEQLILWEVEENKIDIDMQCYYMALTYPNDKEIESIYTHIDKYEKVYLMLEDEYSREIYLSKLNFALSRNVNYLEGLIDDSKQYFDKDIIKLTENEVFVDCGSFDGDTLDIFNELTQGKYKEYIALEADSSTYEKLIQKIKDREYTNVTPFKYACWHKKTELRFNEQQTEGSCVTDQGNILVQADSLDHLLGDKPVTFIKMDIEGAEENALKGAEHLIKKYKPILAISIYHKVEDYYKLPLLIRKFNEDYRLFIRHYREGQDNETICYAIPKERLV